MNINNKLIGIHKKGNDKYNIGTFLNYPIKEFIEQYNDKNEKMLNEFKKKYNYCFDIKNTKIKKLEFEELEIGNYILKDLFEIEFKELKELTFTR